MTAKQMKGVSHRKRKGVEYWYASIDGDKVYCGKGEKGHELAIAAKAKSIAKKYESKEVNAGLKVKKVSFKRVKDLINWYMKLPSIQEQKSFYRKTCLCKSLLRYFGDKPVSAIEADEQENYREYRKRQGRMDQTVNLELNVLGAAYHLALRRKKIPFEVMPGEFLNKGKSVPRKRIQDDEFEKLVKHAFPDDFRDVLICGHESAMRSSEIANLTIGQVHLDVRHFTGGIVDYIDLGIFDTKTGARRTVPVSATLKKILEKRVEGRDPEERVFLRKGRDLYSHIISYDLKRTCKKAGVVYGDKPKNKKGERTGIVFHCLRHTRTSKWVEAGYSDEIIRRATGHATLAAYQKYIKLDPHVVMRLVDEKPKTDKTGTKRARSL